MNIVEKDINELVMYENNPRKNDEAVKYVANSIKEFGFKVPIIVDKDNVIVAGHTRLKAAKKLKIEKVPCIVADDLTEEQIRAFRLADNKVAEFSEWDLPKLDLELMEIFNPVMVQFGFGEEEVESKETVDKRELQSMELKAFEHHDYIVFVFDNQMDWLNICNRFGLKKVNAGYGSTKKVGVGRVVDGKRLLENLQHQSFDFEPWTE